MSEQRSWALWVAHCHRWGTEPIRAYLPAYSLHPEAASAREDLLTLAASFIESCYLEMHPRSVGTFPKPTSAYKIWADVARIHRRLGFPPLDSSSLTAFVKALTHQYRDQHGFQALLPRRKEPISDAEFHHLLHLPDGARLGRFFYTHLSRFGIMWRALLHVLNFTGFRKAEWTVRAPGHTTFMTYHQLVWELDGSLRGLPSPLSTALKSLLAKFARWR